MQKVDLFIDKFKNKFWRGNIYDSGIMMCYLIAE